MANHDSQFDRGNIDFYYSNGYKAEPIRRWVEGNWTNTNPKEQPMRNNIKVLEPKSSVTILSLSSGDMFRYKSAKDIGNVYMKLDGLGKGNSAVHLGTGMNYDVNIDAVLERVISLEITREQI